MPIREDEFYYTRRLISSYIGDVMYVSKRLEEASSKSKQHVSRTALLRQRRF